MKNDNQSIAGASTQADSIFFDALEFEQGDMQKAFVEKACAGNDELRHEVDSRFALLTRVDTFLEEGPSLWITAKDLYDTLSNLIDGEEA